MGFCVRKGECLCVSLQGWVCNSGFVRVKEKVCVCVRSCVCWCLWFRGGIWPTDWEQLVRKRNNEATAPLLSPFFSFLLSFLFLVSPFLSIFSSHFHLSKQILSLLFLFSVYVGLDFLPCQPHPSYLSLLLSVCFISSPSPYTFFFRHTRINCRYRHTLRLSILVITFIHCPCCSFWHWSWVMLWLSC